MHRQTEFILGENKMAAQKGRDLLLKVDSTGAGVYITVAGLRAHTLSFNTDAVDATSQESVGAWRELLAGAGLKTAAIKGQGIFKDAASDASLRGYFFNATIVNWQITIPDFGILQGPFQITALEFAGRHDGEVTFELALESAGPLTFTVI
jgi:TP901-1 family phage major tail protein